MGNKAKRISITSILLVIVMITTVILTSCISMGPMRDLETEEEGIEIFRLENGNILQTTEATGSVESEVQNQYSLQVSGKIIRALERGNPFKQGDVLVEIDNSDALDQLEQIAMYIENAESNLRTAQLNYQKALDENHIAIQIAELVLGNALVYSHINLPRSIWSKQKTQVNLPRTRQNHLMSSL